MTFGNYEIEKIKIDTADDWQPDLESRTFSVMFTGLEEMAEGLFAALLGADYSDWLKEEFPDSYINSYAMLDPVKDECLRILFVFHDGCDEKENREIALAITNEPEAKQLYEKLEYEAEENGMGFKEYVKKILDDIHSDNMEQIGSVIDVFDDFLEDRDVRIPTSDKEMDDAGEKGWELTLIRRDNEEPANTYSGLSRKEVDDILQGIDMSVYVVDSIKNSNAVRIYGSDYDELSEKFQTILGLDDSEVAYNAVR